MTRKITHEDYVAQVAEKNPTITVLGDYAGSHEPILHRCANGHEYKAAPNHVKRGKGCKQCLHESLRESPEDYANWLAENRDDVFMAGPYKGNKVKSLHRCNHGHEWEVMPNSIKQGLGCPTCADIAAHERNSRTTEEYNAELAARGRPFVAIEDYYNSNTSIKHRCDEGHEFVAHPNNLLTGHTGCKVCESLKPLRRFEAWLSENRPGWAVIAEVKNVNTLTTVRCDHGHEFEVTPGTITSGGGCRRCSGSRITAEDYSKWLLEDGRGFELAGEYVTSSTPTLHKCSEGHEWTTAPHNVKHGKGCPVCYAIANNKVVRGTWTEEACVADAQQYQTITEWQASSTAYSSACRNGWLPQCTAHMTRLVEHGKWTKEACVEVALTCQFRSEFKARFPGARRACLVNGWLDECTAHMERCDGGSDNDAVYGWRVITAPEDVDMPAIGKHLVKFGVTSKKLNGSRVRGCAQRNGMTYELIALCDTSEGDAPAFEAALLSMGEAANMPDWIDGKTEFVVMSDEQLGEAMKLLGAKEAQAEAA